MRYSGGENSGVSSSGGEESPPAPVPAPSCSSLLSCTPCRCPCVPAHCTRFPPTCPSPSTSLSSCCNLRNRCACTGTKSREEVRVMVVEAAEDMRDEAKRSGSRGVLQVEVAHNRLLQDPRTRRGLWGPAKSQPLKSSFNPLKHHTVRRLQGRLGPCLQVVPCLASPSLPWTGGTKQPGSAAGPCLHPANEPSASGTVQANVLSAVRCRCTSGPRDGQWRVCEASV